MDQPGKNPFYAFLIFSKEMPFLIRFEKSKVNPSFLESLQRNLKDKPWPSNTLMRFLYARSGLDWDFVIY